MVPGACLEPLTLLSQRVPPGPNLTGCYRDTEYDCDIEADQGSPHGQCTMGTETDTTRMFSRILFYHYRQFQEAYFRIKQKLTYLFHNITRLAVDRVKP